MRRALLIAALVSLGDIIPVQAAMPVVRVAAIHSDKSCTLYKMSVGAHREAGAENAYGAAYASESAWMDYLVRDCVDNFASLKTSIQAALAASGELAIAPGAAGGAYVISGTISDVGNTGPASPTNLHPGGSFAISSSGMFVNMDVKIADRSGNFIGGGEFTKQIETESYMTTRGLDSHSSQSGQAVYGELQHQVALTVARMVAFKIEPLRVTSTEGQTIQLNYGTPLLQLGQTVSITASNGQQVKYTISGAGQGTAEADYYGGGDAARVAPGNTGIVIENAAEIGNRFRKVPLTGAF